MGDKLEDFRPQRNNLNKHTERGLQMLEKSMNEVGFIGAMTAANDGEIFDGSARIEKSAVIFNDVEPIVVETDGTRPVIIKRIDIPNAQDRRAIRAGLLANRVFEVDLDWDLQGLESLLDEDDDLLDGIFSDMDEPESADAEAQIDRAEELQEIWNVQSGDLWRLGEHRLICGDCTDAEIVARVMDGEKANMCHTDPPYNVDYGVSKNPRHKIRSIENDSLSSRDWMDFVDKWGQIIKDNTLGDVYVWGASGEDGMRMRVRLIEMGLHWSATIIWRKQQLVLSPAKYQRMYEPCLYGWFGDKSSFVADRKQTEVWEVDRPLNSKEHPTMKPLELCEIAIRNSCNVGDTVLDIFGGSGSTLLAAQNLGRTCKMVELMPKYCAVILQRFSDAFPDEVIERIE